MRKKFSGFPMAMTIFSETSQAFRSFNGTSLLTKIEIYAVSEFKGRTLAIYMGTKGADFE